MWNVEVKMESLWRKQTQNITSHSMSKDVKWDVIVVGAGMAGLLTAYYLRERGKKVLVLEAKTICSGQTERTTAKITSQHDLKYTKLVETVGMEKARMYAQANESAIWEYEKLIQKKEIPCQFKKACAYLYTTEDAKVLQKEAEVALSLGIDAFFTTETELPFAVTGAVCFRNQAQFSPLEFIQYIASELNILEYTKVIAIEGNKVIAESKCHQENVEEGDAYENQIWEKRIFTAEKIVIATHYPTFNYPGFYFLRQHQERSYVLALSGCEKIEEMYLGIDKDGLSFRQAGAYLLLGGGAHRTGENKDGQSYEFLRQMAKQYFPNGKEEMHWSAQDCMPHDGIPFIGRYSITNPNLYVATGFQKWGMTTSMVTAMILRDELCGIENSWSKLFTPQRMNWKAGFDDLLTDIGVSVKGLAKGAFHIPMERVEDLPYGHGGIIRIDGRRCACYKEESGALHTISARCPHLGCELTWNPDEKSWDCPCHGSRFDIDGNLLDNPAKKNARKR